MLITADMVWLWHPCEGYSRERLAAICGAGLTPVQVCDLPDISIDDKFWALLREELLPARTLRLLACKWAESVLPIFETPYPDDAGPREAIAVGRRFAGGDATEGELTAARAAAEATAEAAAEPAAELAAGAAAGAAARDAARATAGAAARDAAWDPARDAARDAWDAAWDGAQAAQLADVRKAFA